MKKLFYIGLAGLALFEVLNVYFIMPMPGSQRMNSLEPAYFLHSWRWVFRTVFILMAVAGSFYAFRVRRKYIPVAVLLFTLVVVYIFNFQMAADVMFLPPEKVILKTQAENEVSGDRLVIGVEHGGEAKAYPVAFLAYHHQVLDSVGGRPVIVTYCSVCRSARVFEPVVNGRYEEFRLVGMDHFNAMFEDATTGSWWRQVNGQAVIGKRKGTTLPEMDSRQMTVEQWFALYPRGRVMQPDEAFVSEYDSLAKFEKGRSESHLTRTDSLSWKEKSWVVGIKTAGISKAYDWNELKKERIINDRIGQQPVVLVLASDGQSFVAFERPSGESFTLTRDDLLVCGNDRYDLSGQHLSSPSKKLKRIQVYQEFWHSWRTFHPDTQRYGAEAAEGSNLY